MSSLENESLNLLKELSEAFGPSGFEREPLDIVKRAGSRVSDEVLYDKIGSIIFKRKGASDTPKILMAGHMDEVGFVITGIDEASGYLTFASVGGWFDQVLLGHRVTIRTRKGDVIGVIAAKPPHLLTEEEKERICEFFGCSRQAAFVGAWTKAKFKCSLPRAVSEGP